MRMNFLDYWRNAIISNGLDAVFWNISASKKRQKDSHTQQIEPPIRTTDRTRSGSVYLSKDCKSGLDDGWLDGAAAHLRQVNAAAGATRSS
jgi:hypothetical protein